MNSKSLKKFIAIFSLVILVISFLIPNFNDDENFAATVVSIETETTKKKTVGHKIEGAEYYDELWEKYSVIAIDNGGGSGEGGGAGDRNASDAGNIGNYQDAGGVFGQAAGVGLGTGNTANQSGSGSGTSGGTTGSERADALRKLRAQIEESRAESIRKVLETAADAESVQASIAERESIQASIQKRLQQESIKAKITQAETQKQYETPVYVAETTRRSINYDSYIETNLPTSSNNEVIYDNEDETTERALNISTIEPGDLVETTISKNLITNEIKATVDSPTISAEKDIYDDVVETLIEPSMEEFSEPIVEEETAAKEQKDTDDIVESENKDDSEDAADIEDGSGSKGGKDAEKLEDLEGDEGKTESEGHANERGKYQLETEGEYAGKKIFELEQNGNLGINTEHLSVTNMKGIMSSVLTLLFLLGALLFVLSTRDKSNRNNYF